MELLTGLFFRLIFKVFLSRKFLIFKIVAIEKENEILKRRLAGKRIITNNFDRTFFLLLNKIMAIKDHITIVKPATVLRWQRMFIKCFWTFKRFSGVVRRKPVDINIRNLILNVKNENILWGA